MQPLTVILDHKAHHYARQFAVEQRDPRKGKQVYLNTLAVCAVHNYLQSVPITSVPQQGDCWHPSLRAIFNVADLVIPDKGIIECLPVLPQQQTMVIPKEVNSHNLLGYVAVQFQEKLDRVQLLGFAKAELNQESIQLEDLEPLDHLVRAIYPLPEQTNLGDWLEGRFEEFWQPLDAFLSLNKLDTPGIITRAKLINLDSAQLVLVLQLLNPDDLEVRIRLYPTLPDTYLPAELQVNLLDHNDNTYIKAQTREQDSWLELAFATTVGDQFSLRLELLQTIVTEHFLSGVKREEEEEELEDYYLS